MRVVQSYTESSFFLNTFPARFPAPVLKKVSQNPTETSADRTGAAQGKCPEGGEDGDVEVAQLVLVPNKGNIFIISISFSAAGEERAARSFKTSASNFCQHLGLVE